MLSGEAFHGFNVVIQPSVSIISVHDSTKMLEEANERNLRLHAAGAYLAPVRCAGCRAACEEEVCLDSQC